ncbi:MAG: molybdopterin converting factor subunit 1 [Pseudomonadota bacterium]
MITVLYFARFREKLGLEREEMLLPASATAQGLLDFLAARGGPWQELFGCERGVLVAINQAMATRESAIADGDEIAVFPPVTGG